MLQFILVLIIVALAIVYTVYALVKSLRKKDASPCGDCNGCDLKKEITKNVSNKPSRDSYTCGNRPQDKAP
ncbi:MAG: hypothetical protein H6Q19_166 [Bacteroidetes bacterium]|nr:hypothetical protein [Bacteroidota bacterium]